MQRRLIVAPFYRDAKLFERMMLDKGEFDSVDPVYIAIRPEHLRGFRNAPGMEMVETWFIQGNWPCSWHEQIDHMVEMENLARVYSHPYPIRRWFT